MAAKFYCTDRLGESNGKIEGYFLVDINTMQGQYFTSDVVKNAVASGRVEVLNLTLSSDGRLIPTNKGKTLNEILAESSSNNEQLTPEDVASLDEEADKIIKKAFNNTRISPNIMQYNIYPGEYRKSNENNTMSVNTIALTFKKGIDTKVLVKYGVRVDGIDKASLLVKVFAINSFGKTYNLDSEATKIAELGYIRHYFGTVSITRMDIANDCSNIVDCIFKLIFKACDDTNNRLLIEHNVKSSDELLEMSNKLTESTGKHNIAKYKGFVGITGTLTVITVLLGIAAKDSSFIGLAMAINGATAAKSIAVKYALDIGATIFGTLTGVTGTAMAMHIKRNGVYGESDEPHSSYTNIPTKQYNKQEKKAFSIMDQFKR